MSFYFQFFWTLLKVKKKTNKLFHWGIGRPRNLILKFSVYSLHWRQYFPKNQFLVIDGSALNEHPAEQVIRLERFLELEMQITKNNFIKVPERGVMCLKGEGTGIM